MESEKLEDYLTPDEFWLYDQVSQPKAIIHAKNGSTASYHLQIQKILESFSEGRWLLCELLKMLREGNIQIIVEGKFDISNWKESANKFIAGFPRGKA